MVIFFKLELIVVLLLLYFLNSRGQESDEVQFSLEGKWILETIDENQVNAETFAHGVPYIEFKMKDNFISGFTGCNVIQSQCRVTGDMIEFGTIISSKKYCEDIPEHEFLVHLEGTKTFAVKENLLLFYCDEVNVLSFIKEK